MILVIAPGASGQPASMAAHVEGLAGRGVTRACHRPAPAAGGRRPCRPIAAEISRIASTADVIVAGQSYGGRVASLLAAGDPGTYAGLVCFSYPLHRPGHPDWEERTAHWPSLDLPVLLLSGEADPFARIDLLRRACSERLPRATLVTYPGVGHSLTSVLADALDRVAAFAHEIALTHHH